MQPLQSIAMGLVIVGLHAPVNGYDALPDPIGWLLVLLGVAGLPDDLHRRPALGALAGLAWLVSLLLWFPGVADGLYDLHPSLGWAANLPQLGFAAVLCDALARRAVEAREPRAAAWLRVALTGFVVFALLPILVFGAGVRSLELPSYVGAGLALLLAIWLLFSYASRPWAVSRTLPPQPGTT